MIDSRGGASTRGRLNPQDCTTRPDPSLGDFFSPLLFPSWLNKLRVKPQSCQGVALSVYFLISAWSWSRPHPLRPSSSQDSGELRAVPTASASKCTRKNWGEAPAVSGIFHETGLPPPPQPVHHCPEGPWQRTQKVRKHRNKSNWGALGTHMWHGRPRTPWECAGAHGPELRSPAPASCAHPGPFLGSESGW